MPPDQALRAWMDRFVDYMTTKRGMADALRAVIASGGNPFAESRDRLVGGVGSLLRRRGRRRHRARGRRARDVLAEPERRVAGGRRAEQREQAGRLLDLLMDGLRYRGDSH